MGSARHFRAIFTLARSCFDASARCIRYDATVTGLLFLKGTAGKLLEGTNVQLLKGIDVQLNLWDFSTLKYKPIGISSSRPFLHVLHKRRHQGFPVTSQLAPVVHFTLKVIIKKNEVEVEVQVHFKIKW
jgi:hypothetical protein